MNTVITGARGFLGSHVVDSLRRRGVETRALGRQDGDLRDSDVAKYMLYDADMIVHLAANVGGVGYLRSSAGRAFHDNLKLGLNVICAASRGRCRRLILVGTPCAYSSDAELPLREKWLEEGVPTGDTSSYGYAKLACSLVARSVCSMYDKETVTVIPANIYGPRDTFDTERGHVVAALVRKAVVAAERGDKTFDVWGDGTATRDFAYVSDVADGIADVVLSEKRFTGESFNLASGDEISIREIAETIGRAVNPSVTPRFLTDKPIGCRRRVMSTENADASLGYRSSTSLAQGIRLTIDWLRQDTDIIARWVAEDTSATYDHATPRA